LQINRTEQQLSFAAGCANNQIEWRSSMITAESQRALLCRYGYTKRDRYGDQNHQCQYPAAGALHIGQYQRQRINHGGPVIRPLRK
jgi:hypothetical protein